MKINIDQTNINKRLDVFITENYAKIARSQVQKLIKSGQITVNKKSVTPHYFLKNNDVVEIKIADLKAGKKPALAPNSKVKYKKIFEDDNILIINKPAGLLVHPTEKNEQNTLANGLIANYPAIKKVGDNPLRPGLIHRLDKDVSGLMLICKNQKAFDYYKNLFQDRKIEKYYLAFVHGATEKDHDIIKSNIIRSKTKGKMAVRPASQEGKEAITEYWVEKRFPNFTLLKIRIHTGRTHQIRAHLNSRQYPIVGDKLYKQKEVKQNLELPRLFLHSYQLAFIDQNNEPKKFTIELPKELKEVLKNHI